MLWYVGKSKCFFLICLILLLSCNWMASLIASPRFDLYYPLFMFDLYFMLSFIYVIMYCLARVHGLFDYIECVL
jgi:hypothetical protein